MTSSLPSTLIPTLSSTATSSPTQALPSDSSSSSFSAVPTSSGNNDSGSGVGSGGIASSAALYLYTFLATLVLLLAVSAAIVTRSFILRRRHRRMVEEAIRNGTWVAPIEPISNGRPRIDLSKKPVMWEAYLGGGGDFSYGAEKRGGGDHFSPYFPGRGGGYHFDGDMIDWDSIKPVSAAYLGATALESNKPAPLHLPPAVTDQGQGNFARRPLTERIGAGLMHLFSTTSSLPTSPLPNPTQNAGGDFGNGASGEGAQFDVEAGLQPSSQTVQVAVLIAMPRPPRRPSAGSSTTSVAAGAESSTSSSALSPTSSHPLSLVLHSNEERESAEDEPPLPVVEMGVAEVTVVDPLAGVDGQRVSGEYGRGKDGVGRDSASMSGEA